MKIIELRAENVKRLIAVHITPEGSVITVGGKNGAGKSSLLDSIVYALAGAGSLPGKPVRKGEENAEIELTLDGEPNLIVRRRIRDDGKTDLEIRQVSKDGKTTAKLSKPQDVLDKLCGTIAFDPLAFTKLKRQEQAEMLRELVGVSTADLDAEEARLFEERTNVNRDAKRLDAQVSGSPLHKDAPEAEVAAADVLAEIEAVRLHNEGVDKLRKACDDTDAAHAAVAKCLREAMVRADLARQELDAEEALGRFERMEEEADAVAAAAVDAHEAAERKDNALLVAKLSSIEETNAKVRANAARAILVEQQEAAIDQAEDLTKQIEALRQTRLDRLAAAKWPVDGLAFGDSGVTFNGLPFEQCSTAESLRISTAIGLAQHPDLRVLLLRDGPALDEDSLAAIAQLAEEHDAQIWIERVGRGEECSVIIEDGSVAAAKKPADMALFA